MAQKGYRAKPGVVPASTVLGIEPKLIIVAHSTDYGAVRYMS